MKSDLQTNDELNSDARGEGISRARTTAPFARQVTDVPCWLLLAAMVYAPWAYGCTPDWTVTVLEWMLALIFGAWVLRCAARQSWPSVPRLLVLGAVFLVAQGWFMVFNAKFSYDTVAHDFIPLSPWLPWAPGSLDQVLSRQIALQVSVMIAVMAMACDMAREPVWRRRLLWTIAVTGTSLALFGLVQRVAGAHAIFWRAEDNGHTFFATYRYHGNAGAFVNLVWPIVAGFTAMAFLRGARKWKKVAWSVALVICLVGVLVAGSRAANVLALLLGLVWAVWLVCQVLREPVDRFTPAAVVVTIVLLVLLVAAVGGLVGLDLGVERWQRLSTDQTSKNLRLSAYQVCLDMIPQSGWWGFGPGTFTTAFPYFTQRFGERLSGRWLEAHQDYLQTVIEWGYVGAAVWAILIFGGIASFMARFRRQQANISAHARIMSFAAVTALFGVLLHALMDFPLQIASIQLYFAVLLGLLWGGKHWLGDIQRLGRRPKRSATRPETKAVPIDRAA